MCNNWNITPKPFKPAICQWFNGFALNSNMAEFNMTNKPIPDRSEDDEEYRKFSGDECSITIGNITYVRCNFVSEGDDSDQDVDYDIYYDEDQLILYPEIGSGPIYYCAVDDNLIWNISKNRHEEGWWHMFISQIFANNDIPSYPLNLIDNKFKKLKMYLYFTSTLTDREALYDKLGMDNMLCVKMRFGFVESYNRRCKELGLMQDDIE